MGGDFFVDAWSIGDATAWCCRRMLEQETLWGTIEEKGVKLSFSLSFLYCSLFAHNFSRYELLALMEMLGSYWFRVPKTNRGTLILTRYVIVRSY